MYARGQGVPKDYSEGLKWFRKAAEQGDADAQLGLAAMYSQGKGVPEDDDEAIKWLRKAAAQGNAQAVRALQKHTAAQGRAAAKAVLKMLDLGQ